MAIRCKVVGCKKVAVNNTIVCKNHICKCNMGLCKIHDSNGKWIKDFKLRDGTVITDANVSGDEQ